LRATLNSTTMNAVPEQLLSERRRLLLCALALLPALIVLAHFRPFFHDDSYISLRYAERLASGHGLTWNDGERIEGFSNPLLVGFASVVAVIGGNTVLAVRALGVVSVLMLAVVWWRAGANPWLLSVLAANAGLGRWAWGGLETTSFALLCCLGTIQLSKTIRGVEQRFLPTATVLLALQFARPEGVAVALLLALATVWIDRRRGLRLAAVVICASIVLLAARYLYFGELVSNASIAKLDDIAYRDQVKSAWLAMAGQKALWLPLGLVCLTALFAGRARARDTLLLLAPAAAPLAVHLIGGGDHIAGLRFLVPALAVLAAATAITPQRPSQLSRAIPVLALFAIAVQVAGARNEDPRPTLTPALGATVGRFLATHLPTDATVAVATAGSVPYFAPSLRFIDTLGLNDRHIARTATGELRTRWQHVVGHRKGDGNYVLSRNPDVIVLGPATGDLGRDPTAWFLTDYELLQSAEFASRFAPYTFSLLPIDPAAVSPRSVAQRIAELGRIDLVLWIRRDSIAAGQLRSLGTPLQIHANSRSVSGWGFSVPMASSMSMRTKRIPAAVTRSILE